MNSLTGKISEITTSGKLSIVRVNVNGVIMSAIFIDSEEASVYLHLGHDINVIFKESEVIIGTGNHLTISLQNKLEGNITKIDSGELLSKLEIKTKAGIVTSMITTNAVRQLGLEVGSAVTAMIKTNEIMLVP